MPLAYEDNDEPKHLRTSALEEINADRDFERDILLSELNEFPVVGYDDIGFVVLFLSADAGVMLCNYTGVGMPGEAKEGELVTSYNLAAFRKFPGSVVIKSVGRQR